MHSPDLTAANVDKIAGLFPNVLTETLDENGRMKRSIDFDVLRQELSDHVVEGPHERYHLDWPGKRAASFAANTPIAKTLRPMRDESVGFDTTKNLFIEGDNLDALKLLQESYLGKVKLIYIDPPYNTGNDFIYDDDYAESKDGYLAKSGQADDRGARLVANPESNGRFHSDWLSMMYPRLKLARTMLRDDGVIFMSIDDNEVDNLRHIASEVFGAGNFVAQIIWQKVFAPKNSAKWFSTDHDYILVYARDAQYWRPNPLPRTEEMDARYSNPDNDPRGSWTSDNLAARNRYEAGLYPITTPTGRVIEGPPRGNYWRVSERRFEELDADGRIWWGNGRTMPRLKRFLSEVSSGRTPQTLWTYREVGHTQDAKKTLLKYVPFEHTENVLNSVKPVGLIRRILQLATDPRASDIILDFFGGSATTAHAVLEQNAEDGGKRSFISVTIEEPLPQPEPNFDSIFAMGVTRVRNVGAELSAQADTPPGFDAGFRVLKVDTSSMVDVKRSADEASQAQLGLDVESVTPGRAGEDLLFQVLLDWGLDLTTPVTSEELIGHRLFVVDEGALIACFDNEVSSDLVRAIARREPLRAVFRDAGFASDDARINAEQIFREISSGTEVRAI